MSVASLIDQLYASTGVPKDVIKAIYLNFVRILVNSIKEKKYIDVPKIGLFYLVKTPARKFIGRFEFDKKEHKIPAGYKVEFRPSVEFAELLGARRPRVLSKNSLKPVREIKEEQKRHLRSWKIHGVRNQPEPGVDTLGPASDQNKTNG